MMVDPEIVLRTLISEFYSESSVFNWNAITILILVFINIYYSKQINKQIKLAEKDRFAEEMDKLVGPLYSEMREKDFMSERWRKSPLNHADKERQAEFDDFWLNIEKYKYLTSPLLREAIDNYRKIRHKSFNLQIWNELHGKPNPNENEEKIAIESLHAEVIKRYNDLQIILSNEQIGKIGKFKAKLKNFWPFSKN